MHQDSLRVNGLQLTLPSGVDPALMQQLGTELERVLAESTPRIAQARTTDYLTPEREVTGADVELGWEYNHTGDYDQNGEVNVADLTPIGQHFGKVAAAAWDAAVVADGDGNGEINISDVTPIGQNFGEKCAEYVVESADNPDGPWTEIARVPLGDGWKDPTGGLLWFDVNITGGAATAHFRVWADGEGGDPPPPPGGDKMELWTDGPKLRGINIWQVPFHPYYDDAGTNPVVPPYTNQEFADLKAMGCNYINISGPGLFSVSAPYQLDPDIQANLDQLLARIEANDMFAVITARTGPGRSQFSIGGYEGIPPEDINEDVWSVPAARAAWVDMWTYTANRYKENPIVVGYDLMCEPNSNVTMFPSPVWSPEDFYPGSAGSAIDWNPLSAEIVAGIRAVDQETPIIISSLGMGQPEWLPFLKVIEGDDRLLYATHQYPPMEYTHPDDGPSFFEPDPPPPGWTPNDMLVKYPGSIDGRPFNQSTLFAEAHWQEVVDFQTQFSATVMTNEWGPQRFLVGASDYFTHMSALFEQYGVNNACWIYATNFRTERHYPYNEWNFRYGTDFDNLTEVPTSSMHSAIETYWGLNTIFPSTWGD